MLLLSTEGPLASFLGLPWRPGGNEVFFFALSESDAFRLFPELLEFSESEELDSLPELDELLDDDPELLLEVDSELVVYEKMIILLRFVAV